MHTGLLHATAGRYKRRECPRNDRVTRTDELDFQCGDTNRRFWVHYDTVPVVQYLRGLSVKPLQMLLRSIKLCKYEATVLEFRI